MLLFVLLTIGSSIWCVNYFFNNKLGGAIAAATSRQAEPLSELYFTDYNALPKRITAGKQYQASFTVANHEGRARSYLYREVLVENGKPRSFPPVSFQLANGASAPQLFYFNALKPGDSVEVIITINANQSIHYKAQS